MELLIAGALACHGHTEQPTEAKGSSAGVRLLAIVGNVLIADFL